jgi:hypothetical protein
MYYILLLHTFIHCIVSHYVLYVLVCSILFDFARCNEFIKNALRKMCR